LDNATLPQGGVRVFHEERAGVANNVACAFLLLRPGALADDRS